MARGGEPRAGPGLRLGPRHRGLLPRHGTRPALALLSRPGAGRVGFLWILMRPGTITDPPAGASRDVMRAAYFDPNYVSVLKYQNEIIVFLLVSAGLALLVRRSRALVAERAEAERARGNL